MPKVKLKDPLPTRAVCWLFPIALLLEDEFLMPKEFVMMEDRLLRLLLMAEEDEVDDPSGESS